MKRRFFLFAAPAIVAAPSLMRVSTLAQFIMPAPQPIISISELVNTTLRNRSHLLAASVMKNNAILQRLMEGNEVGSGDTWTYYGRMDATLQSS